MRLIIPKIDSAVKRYGLETLRKDYMELAHQTNSILQGEIHRCSVCGEFLSLDKFYSNDQFAMKIFPICKECLLEMATDYDSKLKRRIDNRTKTIRVFSVLDIPFYEDIYQKCLENIKNNITTRGKTAYQQMLTQISSLPQYQQQHFSDSSFGSGDSEIGYEFETNRKARREIKKLFGAGFTEGDYLYLQDQYDDFRARTQVDSKSQEVYVTQICLLLLEIDKDRKSGKDITKKLATLDSLMAAAKLQPKQNVTNGVSDTYTFSELLEKWEVDRPVPEPDPEFKDVDGIFHLLKVWFGWILKALGIKNAYTAEYEKEAEKYEVQPPNELSEVVNEDNYARIFGKDGDS